MATPVNPVLTITQPKFPGGGSRFKVRGTISFTGNNDAVDPGDYTTGGLVMQYSGLGGTLTNISTLADLKARLGLTHELSRFVVDTFTRSSGATGYIGVVNMTSGKLQLLAGDGTAGVNPLAELAEDSAIPAATYTAQFEAEGF